MQRSLINNKIVKDDYADLRSYLIAKNILSGSNSEIDTYLKLTHKYIFGLSFWDYKLKSSVEHRRIYLKEIRSNALEGMILPLWGFRSQSLWSPSTYH